MTVLADRYEKRHKNLAAHISPAFRAEHGDIVTVGEFYALVQFEPLTAVCQVNVAHCPRRFASMSCASPRTRPLRNYSVNSNANTSNANTLFFLGSNGHDFSVDIAAYECYHPTRAVGACINVRTEFMDIETNQL